MCFPFIKGTHGFLSENDLMLQREMNIISLCAFFFSLHIVKYGSVTLAKVSFDL